MPPTALSPSWLGRCTSSPSGRKTFSSPFQSEMFVWQPFAGDAHERLRHEAREGALLAPDLLRDLAEGREVVGRALRAVEAEVQLDLPGRVLVVALDHVEPELCPYSTILWMIGWSSENWSMW